MFGSFECVCTLHRHLRKSFHLYSSTFPLSLGPYNLDGRSVVPVIQSRTANLQYEIEWVDRSNCYLGQRDDGACPILIGGSCFWVQLYGRSAKGVWFISRPVWFFSICRWVLYLPWMLRPKGSPQFPTQRIQFVDWNRTRTGLRHFTFRHTPFSAFRNL